MNKNIYLIILIFGIGLIFSCNYDLSPVYLGPDRIDGCYGLNGNNNNLLYVSDKGWRVLDKYVYRVFVRGSQVVTGITWYNLEFKLIIDSSINYDPYDLLNKPRLYKIARWDSATNQLIWRDSNIDFSSVLGIQSNWHFNSRDVGGGGF